MWSDILEERYCVYAVFGYLVIMNLIGFYSMWSDKKKAKAGAWRTPESTLMMIAVLGGSAGSLMGMKRFRHKTKHPKFYVGIPVILVLQVIMILVTCIQIL